MIVQKQRTTIGFVVTTILTLPAMLALFILTEFDVPKVSILLKHFFYFLDFYIGKGIWLLLIAFMILEKPNVFTVLLFVVVLLIAVINIAIGFITKGQKLQDLEAKEEKQQIISSPTKKGVSFSSDTKGTNIARKVIAQKINKSYEGSLGYKIIVNSDGSIVKTPEKSQRSSQLLSES